MKMWKSETGFTLIELTVVMAVMGVFIAAMTGILMVAFDVHTEIVQENKEQAGAVLVTQHLERMIKSSDRSRSFGLTDNPLDTASGNDDKALRIQVNTDPFNPLYVFYYVDPVKKTMCFEYGSAIDASNPKMELGSGILSVTWKIEKNSVGCELKLESAAAGGATQTESMNFALKSEQEVKSTPAPTP